MKIKQNQSGQILLIIVLLSTVLLTVGLSVSRIGTEETKISKLEEDSKRAFAAAEGGLEQTLKLLSPSNTSETFTIGGVEGTASLDITPSTDFVSPALKKDEQYTFYLGKYENNTFSAPYFSGNVTVYFADSTTYDCASNPPAIEVTFVDTPATPVLRRFVYDPPCGRIQNASSVPSGNYVVDGTTFHYASPALPANASGTGVVIVRALYAGTRIGLHGTANLSAQGKTVISTAATTTGVSKKIQLFQSYPQIPADFFVTSF